MTSPESSDRSTSPYLLPTVMVVLAITAVFVAWRLAQPARGLPSLQPPAPVVAAPPPAPLAPSPSSGGDPPVAVASVPSPGPARVGAPRPAPSPVTLNIGGIQMVVVQQPGPDAPGVGDDLFLPDPAPPPLLPKPPPPSAWKVVGTPGGASGTLTSDDALTGGSGEAIHPMVVAGCTAGRRYLVFDPGVPVTPTVVDGQAYMQAVVIWPDGDLEDVRLEVRRNSTAGLFPLPNKWITKLQSHAAFSVSYQGSDGAPIEVRFTNRDVDALTAELAGCR